MDHPTHSDAHGDAVDELLGRIGARVSDIGGGGGNGGKGGNGGRRGGGGDRRDPFAQTFKLATDYALRLTLELAGDLQNFADATIVNDRALAQKITLQDQVIADLTQRIERLEAEKLGDKASQIETLSKSAAKESGRERERRRDHSRAMGRLRFGHAPPAA